MPGWSGSWFGDWEGAWLGVQTDQPHLTITDTDILQMPVDVVLAGQQLRRLGARGNVAREKGRGTGQQWQ